MDAESTQRPGYCVGCDNHITEMERRSVGDIVVRTNESHNPNDWTFEVEP